jgi:hypothetical protein
MKKLALLLLFVTPALAGEPELKPVHVLAAHIKRPTEFQRADKVEFVIQAYGEVATPGWAGARLRPRNDEKLTADGYIEYDLVAIPPAGTPEGAPQEVEASVPVKEIPIATVQGLRVFGADGSESVHKIYHPPHRKPK